MQENNLEGKVHDIMEGFIIDPSEKVWANIQADIARQKKSRFGILPVTLLMGCFLLMTFFLHDLEQKQPVAGLTGSSSVNAIGQSLTATQKDLDSKTAVVSSQKNKIQQTGKNSLNTVDLHQINKLIKTEKNKINHLTQTATAAEKENEINEVTEKAEVQQDKDIAAVKTVDVITTSENKKDSILQIVAVQKDLIKTNDAVVNEKKELESANKKIITKKEKAKSKWDFFIAVAAGRFSTGSSYLGQTANSEYYDSPAASNGSGTPPSGFIRPSQVKPGFSFNTVVKANRKLSAKTGIIVGLGYQYAGTSITTGQILSGASRDNFAAGTVNEFQNKYHFIQLPVEIQSMIGKGNKLPLYWNAGFTFSRLISAEVLQFDRSRGIYFKDNSYFNKTTVGVSGGLSLGIFKNQKTPWLIGPQFYYSLTPVAGSGLYNKTHYSFFGLQLQKKL